MYLRLGLDPRILLPLVMLERPRHRLLFRQEPRHDRPRPGRHARRRTASPRNAAACSPAAPLVPLLARDRRTRGWFPHPRTQPSRSPGRRARSLPARPSRRCSLIARRDPIRAPRHDPGGRRLLPQLARLSQRLDGPIEVLREYAAPDLRRADPEKALCIDRFEYRTSRACGRGDGKLAQAKAACESEGNGCAPAPNGRWHARGASVPTLRLHPRQHGL
jgi:hypothetical protein